MKEGAFEPGPHWEGKTGFAVGVPDDPALIPTLHYQLLYGRVYTVVRRVDDSVSHGEITLAEFEGILGRTPTKEGWYDAIGTYLGVSVPEA